MRQGIFPQEWKAPRLVLLEKLKELQDQETKYAHMPHRHNSSSQRKNGGKTKNHNADSIDRNK